MATAYQSAPHGEMLTGSWDHAESLSHDNLGLTNRNLFASSNTYDTNQSSRDASSYGQRRPSQQANTLDINSSQADYIKRDSGKALRSERGIQQGTPDPSPTRSQKLRSSASQGRLPVATTSQPKSTVISGLSPEDSAAWIHRDKLARIESQEMAAAGFAGSRSTQRRQGRSHSRSTSRSATRATNTRAQSGDRHANTPPMSQDPAPPSLPAFDERSSDRSKNDQDDDYEERLQEEPRVDRMYSKSLPRPITSRIPVARASPAPLSQSVVERDSPLTRGGLYGGSVNGDKFSRSRSQSLGSQAAMAESITSRTPTTTSRQRPRSSHLQDSTNSPATGSTASRTKQPVKTTPGSVNRKGTNTKTPLKTRTSTVSQKDSSVKRRPTSSSNRSRPTSFHNRPEGDAPWIAHMYKPDPRLPPDQQMLPTHAKRMMQQQWETDGSTGDAYDRDFNLLNDNDLAKMGALPTAEQIQQEEETKAAEAKKQQDEQEALRRQQQQPPWPLTSNKSDGKGQGRDTPQSQKGHQPPRGVPQGFEGGYRITPTIESPNATHRPNTKQEAPRPQKPAVQRVPDPDEKADGKKKKGCACCIVM